MAEDSNGALTTRKDFKDTPEEQYKYWEVELKNSNKNLRQFREDGAKIVTRFKGGNRSSRDQQNIDKGGGNFQLNLFHSNVITLQSMLYGNLPKVDVSRRYSDPNDDVGRVAATVMERLLTNDVEENAESYNSNLKAALQDRLLPGLGVGRVRYEFNEETEEETAPVEYYHWRDVAWGWGRTFSDLPWIGFRSFLAKDEVEAKFGKDAAEAVQLKNQQVTASSDEEKEPDTDSAWQKAEVWEIWDKAKKKVVWLSPGYDKILATKDDFLNLSGFYPCPPFLLANQTTSFYLPVSDYYLSQDLYNEIDHLQQRISILTEAVKVVGVYDRSAEGLDRMFKEGTDNDLIPVDNWALFAEGGGIKGSIDWVPIKDVVNALLQLRELRDETIGLLQQVTGMSDIMRGELGGQYEGVGQSQLKAKFGSVRVQALQDEFATFASNLLALKAEVIARHFDTRTIAQRANVESFQQADFEKLPEALELIKAPEEARLRVVIRPESVAMVDYAQLKQERTDYITALATFMQSAQPLMESDPNAKPFLLQLLQWGLAGFKGAGEIEGVIDKAIQASQQEAQQERPDPEQVKMQGEMEKIEAKKQADLQVRQADLQADIQTEQVRHQNKLREEMAASQAKIAEIRANLESNILTERVATQANIQQTVASAETEMVKDTANAELSIATEAEKTRNKIDEISAASSAKIKELAAAPKQENTDGDS